MARTPKSTTVSSPDASGAGTLTLTEHDQPAVKYALRSAITGLRFFGTNEPAPFTLPASKRLFTIGVGACDLVIPRALSPKVSGFHAALERVDDSSLHVLDQQSKNGTFKTLGENKLGSFYVQAGVSFWLANVRLMPMDTELEVLRPRLTWCLGLDHNDLVDQALEAIATGAHLALVGPTGTDALRLAEAIHNASPQRNNFMLKITAGPLPSLDLARGGTVFVDLDEVKRVSAPWLKALFTPERGLRAIFAATTDKGARARLDTYRDRVTTIALTPLARRKDEIVRLLALHWIEELRTRRRVAELPNLDAITAHDWTRNFDELREASPKLLAYLEHRTLRGAAAALGISHQALSKYFQRIRFPTATYGDLED